MGLIVVLTTVGGVRPSAGCVGDCNGDGKVTIDELVRAVNIALNDGTVDTCDAIDNDRNGMVSVDELVRAIGKSLSGCSIGTSGEVLMSPQGGELDEYDLGSGVTTVGVPNTRVQARGQVCLLPGGSGNYVVGDDTGAPPSGWSIFSPDGTFLQKLPLPPVQENDAQGGVPVGCAVDASGRLFLTGLSGEAGIGGQLWMRFPPDYTSGCLLDTTLQAPGAAAIDSDGVLYVPEAGAGTVLRFAPPFPSSLNDCALRQPPQQQPRSTFIQYADGAAPSAVAQGPNGHWFVTVAAGSGSAQPSIREHDSAGTFLREVLSPGTGGDPVGIAFDGDGNLYYADLGVTAGSAQAVAGKGTVRKISFDDTDTPSTPELIASRLTAPNGLAVLPSRADEWVTLGGSLRRTFFNPREHQITGAAVPNLILKWRYQTSGMINAQPAVVWVDLPGEGRTELVIVPSWDQRVYALRASNGSRVWQFVMKPQPGTFYPYAGSPTITWVEGQPRVVVPGGETMYCLDATNGAEIWEFDAGTGCTTCTAKQERNEIESTPAVVNGMVIASMDTNDGPPGKGGMFALRLDDGRLIWWFDLFTQSTCRPNANDNIRKFDGYHTVDDLGLPADFFATRSGCDFDRSSNGCGNVWSSPTVDTRRGLIFTDSANCDTGAPPLPPPPPPPFEEAIFALTFDGTPAWHWRPREVDDRDLDFGAVPNLFEAEIGGQMRDLVGVGGKDGTYYVLDRSGVNALTGKVEPYWKTNVVPGGSQGGMIGSASVGENHIVVATAPGESVFSPQEPIVHAFDPGTGTVLWENADVDPAFGSTMGVPGLALTGGTPIANLNFFDRADGVLLRSMPASTVFGGISAAPTVVGGMVFVGGGTGAQNSGSDAEGQAVFDTPVSAFCVQGTPGCAANTCNDHNPCTYDYLDSTGACVSQPSADDIDCRMGTMMGTCSNGTCVFGTPAPTATPGEG
jgi:outer membrane protein assembly factor BamB